MEKMKIIVAIMLLIFLSGCFGRQYTRSEIFDNFTPSGCYYDFKSELFDCIDSAQKDYLNANLFTPEELKELNDPTTLREGTVMNIVIRLHDCTENPNNSNLACRYSFTADSIWRISRNAKVVETKENGKFIYEFSEE
jgi:hypothetical protein